MTWLAFNGRSTPAAGQGSLLTVLLLALRHPTESLEHSPVAAMVEQTRDSDCDRTSKAAQVNWRGRKQLMRSLLCSCQAGLGAKDGCLWRASVPIVGRQRSDDCDTVKCNLAYLEANLTVRT